MAHPDDQLQTPEGTSKAAKRRTPRDGTKQDNMEPIMETIAATEHRAPCASWSPARELLQDGLQFFIWKA